MYKILYTFNFLLHNLYNTFYEANDPILCIPLL